MRFYSFIPAHTLIRSVLHFFPSAERVVAPYPVSCKIAFFREREIIKSLALDGLRLSQPDGVKVEDLLSPQDFESQHGLIGVEIELDTKGRGADLSLSDCIVEIECQDYSVQYRAQPKVLGGRSEFLPSGGTEVSIEDGAATSYRSFVFINSSEESQSVSYEASTVSDNEPLKEEIALQPRQVVERQVTSNHSGACQKVRFLKEAMSEQVYSYVLYRDESSNLPLSVTYL